VVNVRTSDFDGSKGDASGVVIDRRGIIVTNNHVIEGARTITVTFNDGRHRGVVRAEVVGTAPERDLAIIHVGLTDLVPVPLGRSSRLRLGDDVLAIGFPLGLGGPTVTRGIVSGLDRTIRPDTGPPLEGLLQTDAAINPGNSGGALVNLAGQLVGINTAAAQGRSAQNIGFSIAIDQARTVIDEIRSKPAGQRSWIGASLDSIDSAASAVQLGLPPEVRGAVVVAVFAGGPAALAGVREGDVIVSVNGSAVLASNDVTKALRSLNPGDSLTLELVDRSGPRRATLTLAKRPATLSGG
jgi:S1-C subfamily serine protease